MDFLMRDDSKLTSAQWDAIDKKVVEAARSVLVGRRLLDVYGPIGAGIQAIEAPEGGQVRPVEIPLLGEDVTLSWRELQTAETLGIPLSLANVASAAVSCALQEDRLVFLGDEERGVDGILTAPGVERVTRGDWSQGEAAFADVAAGLQRMLENRTYGQKALVVSPDVYVQLQRIQPGTGTLEAARIAALIDGRILQTPTLPTGTAALVATGEQNMDLVIGQDMVTAYLGNAGMDYELRVFETVLPRLKNAHAVIVFEG